MQNETRKLFNAYRDEVANLNGVTDVSEKFTATPSVQQRMENRMQESVEFLGRINNVGVDEQQGEKIGLGIGAPVSGTTNTATTDRAVTDPTTLDADGYLCTQTNFDTYLSYSKLDMWAKFPDFQTRIRNMLLTRAALDAIMIGFNGTSRAATSDKVANPMLQDVNIGWLEKIRQFAPERYMDEVAASSGTIEIGSSVAAANGYKNIDALVHDMVNNLMEPWYREDTELVCVVGRKLISDKMFGIINVSQAPTEQLATKILTSQVTVGALPAVRVPYFPDDAILVTRLDNLSRYYQNGKRRRTIVDNAKRDRIENYESSNDAYVVEDYGLTAFAENIELVD